MKRGMGQRESTGRVMEIGHDELSWAGNWVLLRQTETHTVQKSSPNGESDKQRFEESGNKDEMKDKKKAKRNAKMMRKLWII